MECDHGREHDGRSAATLGGLKNMVKRVLAALLGVVLLVLLMAGPAIAATPQDIYDDFVTNGTLTGTYTVVELETYLDDAVIHQYGDQAVLRELDILVRKLLAQPDRPVFPFTGFELLLIGMGGAALVGVGVALRRSTHRREN
jgi:hypothetical protein